MENLNAETHDVTSLSDDKEKSLSIDEAVNKAFDSVENSDYSNDAPQEIDLKQSDAADKETANDELEEDVNNEFDDKFSIEPPARFSAAAKKEWANVPLNVKSEVIRATEEMEKGIRSYQEKFEELKPYEEISAKAGRTLAETLNNYVGLEKLLSSDPVKGLGEIFNAIGINEHEYASYILGQDVNANISAQNQEIKRLKNENESFRQQVSEYAGQIEHQEIIQISKELEKFAASKPRYEELRPLMAKMFDQGLADNLEEAYQYAEQLKPAALQTNASFSEKTNLVAQKDKTKKSINGFPSAGSNPQKGGGRALSIEESVNLAFADLGMS